MAGIYIHIPFCKQSCSYCDFHFSTSLKHKTSLIKSLVQEIGDVKWLSYEELLGMFREYEVEKIAMIKKFHKQMVHNIYK